MKLLRLAIFLIVMAFPALALAAPPPVMGIQAQYLNGQIHVSWTAPQTAETITSYRIYYSRQSILGNGGKYDDFATTTGKLTDYILTDFPKAPRLYISVLATNDKGVEGTSFGQEAIVDIPQTGDAASAAAASLPFALPDFFGSLPSSSASVSPPTTVAAASTLQLLSATPVSATGVALTFSAPVLISNADAATAFVIDDGSGHLLGLRRLIIAGPQVTIQTEPQVPGQHYTVRVSSSVQGQVSAGSPLLQMDPQHSSADFTNGQALPMGIFAPTSGNTSSISAPPPQLLTSPAPIANVNLITQPKANGFYRVVATWDVGLGLQPASIEIRQSINNGKTLSKAQRVSGTTRSVKFENVRPGQFGISIAVIDAKGTSGTPVFTNLPLLAAITPDTTPLAQTGPEVLLLTGVAGAAAGWIRARGKKTPASA